MDLSFTYLHRLPSGAVYESVMSLLEKEILKVDKGSEFEKLVKPLENLQPRKKIEVLQQWGCRAFLGMHENKPLSFLALQFHEHPRPVGVFRVHRDAAYEHNGVGTKTVNAFINDCFGRKEQYERIEISKGGDDRVVKILTRLKSGAYQGPYTLAITPELGRVQRLQ